MHSIWARKPLQCTLDQGGDGEASERGGGLQRSLGLPSTICLGVGALIGAGIFVLTGQAAAEHAGPAILLSFLLAGVICALVGLCYSEMAACCPVAGSAYTYAYATLGEIVAWIIGWDLILEYALGATTVAIGWSGYVGSLLADLGLPLPAAIARPPFSYDPVAHAWSATGAILNVPAMAATLSVSGLLLIGVTGSARVNNALVALKVGIVLLFIAAGIGYVTTQNWVVPGKNPDGAFIPPNGGRFGLYGLSGILSGTAAVFFAYVGFDAVSTAAQEVKRPERTLPLGMLLSIAICTLLFCGVCFVITGIVPFEKLADPAPIAAGPTRSG